MKEFALLVLGVLGALMLCVLALSIAAKWLAPHIPFSWERHASPYLAQALSLESSVEEPRRQALTELVDALLATAAQSERAPAQGWEIPTEAFTVHFSSMDAPNAMATLGAQIVVTEGLFAHISSENGLAMVIAHEIAHVLLRHPIESLGRGAAVQLVLLGVIGGQNSSAVAGLLNSGSLLTLLSFSRDMEREADELALEIVKMHYGHLHGADEFFTSMEAGDSTAQWLEFTQTHPNIERRVETLREAIGAEAEGQLKALPSALVIATP